MILSIVVPVYNAEKYIERCLKSLVITLDGVSGEIILVDNGSTDSSPAKMQKFHEKYPGIIRIFKTDVSGAGAARNLGAKHARGKYLWFVDADDTVAKTAAKRLLDAAHGADIVMMGAKRIYAGGHTDLLTAVDANDENYRSRFVRYGAGPWQFLFKTSWWKENDFRFEEGIIHEDMELISSLILFTDNFASVDAPLYFYYQNSGSVLHKEKFDPHCFDIFPALTGLYKKFQAKKAVKTFHDELEWFFIWNLLIDSAKDFSKNPLKGKAGFSRARKMLREYFPKWRKNKFFRAKPLKFRIRAILNYHK